MSVPDGEIEVTMTCPVCREAGRGAVDCEMLGPDGWECPTCRTTWDVEGRHGEAHARPCARCGSAVDWDDPPPPECSQSGEEGVYCSPEAPRVLRDMTLHSYGPALDGLPGTEVVLTRVRPPGS